MLSWRALPPDGGARPGAVLTSPALARAGVRAAFTTRLGGVSDTPYESLNLSYVSGDDPERVRANRARVLRALGVPPDAWTNGRQVHGARAARAGAAERGRGAFSPDESIPDTDALWTDEPGLALAVLGADCAPVLLADPARRRIGVAHAGWRGLVAGVLGALVEAMGASPSLAAWVGPAIGPCCYEVGDDVAAPARRALGEDVVRGGRLDLWAGCAGALRRAGVAEIWLSALCTRCEPWRFYSHRAGDIGRQGVVAALGGGR